MRRFVPLRSRGRLGLVGAVGLAATVAVALTLTSLQWGVPFGSSRSLVRYTDGDISFSYPADWHTAVASGELTTQGCVGCGFVLSSQSLLPGTALLARALAPGGALITWGAGFGERRVDISQVSGSLTRLGGYPAKVTATKGDCSGWDADNADESMTAYIAARGGAFGMDACLRAPVGHVKGQVEAMLQSVSFRPPRR